MQHAVGLLAVASLILPRGPAIAPCAQRACRSSAQRIPHAPFMSEVRALEETGVRQRGKKPGGGSDDWSSYLRRQRYERLRDIALSISVRRTVDEAEVSLYLCSLSSLSLALSPALSRPL